MKPNNQPTSGLSLGDAMLIEFIETRLAQDMFLRMAAMRKSFDMRMQNPTEGDIFHYPV